MTISYRPWKTFLVSFSFRRWMLFPLSFSFRRWLSFLLSFSFRRWMLLLLSVLLLGQAVAAQQTGGGGQEKLDTTTADTIVVGANVSPPSLPPDTSTLAGAGESSASVSQDTVVLRSIPDSILNTWKKSPRFAYANDPAYWQRRRAERYPFAEWLLRLFSSAGFRYFILIVLGGLLAFAILRIMFENNLGLFYRRRVKKAVGGSHLDGETGPEEDLDERLQYFLGNRDHRQAVRYLYLRSLRALGERGLIQAGGPSTNHEYLRQLAGTRQEAPFRFLTGAYEKVWYGEFVPGDEAFHRLHQYFEDFDKTIAV